MRRCSMRGVNYRRNTHVALTAINGAIGVVRCHHGVARIRCRVRAGALQGHRADRCIAPLTHVGGRAAPITAVAVLVEVVVRSAA